MFVHCHVIILALADCWLTCSVHLCIVKHRFITGGVDVLRRLWRCKRQYYSVSTTFAISIPYMYYHSSSHSLGLELPTISSMLQPAMSREQMTPLLVLSDLWRLTLTGTAASWWALTPFSYRCFCLSPWGCPPPFGDALQTSAYRSVHSAPSREREVKVWWVVYLAHSILQPTTLRSCSLSRHIFIRVLAHIFKII